MAAPVLETENLVKIYGRGDTRFDALKGINLEIGKGESVAVVGKSGSGKSTLMHLLALLDAPTHGVVALEGRPTGDLGAKELNELRNSAFGFVFQQFFLTPNQSVLENVTLPLKIAGVPASERKRRGLEALEQLEMADKADNKATDLSGGQKQRVVIARALINDPSVVFTFCSRASGVEFRCSRSITAEAVELFSEMLLNVTALDLARFSPASASVASVPPSETTTPEAVDV